MINYQILHDSVQYYEQHGFKRIESPWTVTASISAITKPEWANEFTIKEKNKVLVASGEQSFLCLYNKGFLPKGKFQTITPCFRDETFDLWHTKYFMKNELIDTEDVSVPNLFIVVEIARKFFEKSLKDNVDLVTVVKDESYDLCYRDIELGSYGIRHCDYLSWIYGTGCAEPRLSRVMKKYGIPH